MRRIRHGRLYCGSEFSQRLGREFKESFSQNMLKTELFALEVSVFRRNYIAFRAKLMFLRDW